MWICAHEHPQVNRAISDSYKRHFMHSYCQQMHNISSSCLLLLLFFFKSFHMFNMFSNSLMRKLSILASLFHLQKRFFYLHSWILTFHCPLPPHCWAPGRPWWSSPWLSWPHGTGAPTIETQQVELLEYRYVGRTFVKSGNTDSPSPMKVKLITQK